MKLNNQHSCNLLAGVLIFFACTAVLPASAQTPPSPFEAKTSAVAKKNNDEAESASLTATTQKPTRNIYLETFMTLQHQNAVLRQLLEREKSIVTMVKSYKNIGINYDAPKPDLKTCQELPKNLSCALAYPDKYADFLPPPMPLPAVPVIPVAISTDDLPQPIVKLSADSGLKNLMWTDITCLQGSCRAVITPDPSDPAARYSVKAGDSLPPGGTVERISYAGVTIVKGSETITVPPAPTRPFSM
jgi:hypothetical protein